MSGGSAESDGSPVNFLAFNLEFLDPEIIENITTTGLLITKVSSTVSSSCEVISIQLPEVDLSDKVNIFSSAFPVETRSLN